MMQVLFTRSSSPLSRAIRHLTGEPVSHVVLLVDGYMVHSNLLGLHIDELHTLEVVYMVDLDPDYEKLFRLYSRYQHASYDMGALLYLGLRCLMPFLPKANLWQSTGMFMCTEWVTEYLDDKEDSMITPYQLYERIKKT